MDKKRRVQKVSTSKNIYNKNVHQKHIREFVIISIVVVCLMGLTLLFFFSDRIVGKASGFVVDCENSYDCFVQAANDCIPAKAVIIDQYLVENLYVLQLTSSLELQGYQNTSCRFNEAITGLSVSLDVEQLQIASALGVSISEINAKKESLNAYLQQFAYAELECLTPTENLTTALQEWKLGNFYEEQLEELNCTGDLFDFYTEMQNISLDLTLPDLAELEINDNLTDETIIDNTSINVTPDASVLNISLPLLSALEVSKLTTKIIAGENITTKFWVITTLKDKDGTTLILNKVLIPSLNAGEPFLAKVEYPFPDSIERKEVLVYDTFDPSKWKVHLNETFVKEYGSS